MSVSQHSYTLILLACAFGMAGCNRSPEAREAKALKRAALFVQARDYPRAELELRNAMQAMPKDAEPYYQLGLIQVQNNDPRIAYQTFRKALQLNPKHQGAALKAEQLMAHSGRAEDVEDAARRLAIAASQPGSGAETIDTLAFAEWRLGDSEDAAKLLTENLAKYPKNLQSALNLAQLKADQKDFAGAEQVLKTLIKNLPDSAPAARALGRFYLITRKPDLAEAQMRKAAALDPKDGAALAYLAAIDMQGGRKAEAESIYRRLSALEDKRYRPVHALFLWEDGRRSEALAEFEHLVKEDSKDHAERTRLIAAYVTMGDDAKAENLLNVALQHNQKDEDALIMRASLYLTQGKNSQAETDLHEALHYAPNSIPAHVAVARLYQQQGQTLMERQELNRVLELNPAMLSARLRLARLFTSTREGGNALELIDRLPESQKHLIPVIIERNWALCSLGQTKEFLAGIEAGKARGPSPEWSLQAGVAHLSQAAYAEARKDTEAFLQERPEDLRGVQLLTEVYGAQKQSAAATQRLRDLASQHPKSAELQRFLGEWLAKTGDLKGARGALQTARADDPKSREIELDMIKLDMADHKEEAARTALTVLLHRNPRNIQALMLLADLDMNSLLNQQAIAGYRSILDIDGNNLLALNNLAYLLSTADPDQALPYGQKAMELAPGNPSIQDTLGSIYYRKRMYAKAVEYLKTAVERDPTPKRQFHLGMSYLREGDRDHGQQLIALAVSKQPNIVQTETGW